MACNHAHKPLTNHANITRIRINSFLNNVIFIMKLQNMIGKENVDWIEYQWIPPNSLSFQKLAYQ